MVESPEMYAVRSRSILALPESGVKTVWMERAGSGLIERNRHPIAARNLKS
jgi:hypothetical protein